MKKLIRRYYKIRFKDSTNSWNEYYCSRNGTDQWNDIAKVKAIITRGIPTGFKGMILKPFENYEIVAFKEEVSITEEVITL